ncbi:MAG TPA: biotin--[acetyl-CoA-carboxylase] ligase [Gammaproteobacteria bacterium]
MRQLADGRCHSGEALAARFGVTPAAVREHVATLERWGLEVDTVPGGGLRLGGPLDLLDAEALCAAVAPRAARRVERLEIFTELDSTNRYLLETALPGPGAMTVCIAEFQHGGRGRRGRRWYVPIAAGLCLSAGWRFARTPSELGAFPLAVGVVVRRVIARLCGIAVELKWPNDLVWDGRKLGGILVESVADGQGGLHAVAGIGINVAMPDAQLAVVSDWPRGAADLAHATGGAPPRRLRLAAALIEALADAFASYPASGFAPYRDELAAADCLCGERVVVADVAETWSGTARGIDASGALLVVDDDGRARRVISGDVTVRRRS